jgi:hypothetical protein
MATLIVTNLRVPLLLRQISRRFLAPKHGEFRPRTCSSCPCRCIGGGKHGHFGTAWPRRVVAERGVRNDRGLAREGARRDDVDAC